MAVLETHIFKAHNNIYIEQPEENYRTREIRTEMVSSRLRERKHRYACFNTRLWWKY